MPLVEDRIRDRLGQLAACLGDADWLDGDFTCGDLMTVDVLQCLEGSGLTEEVPNLAAWVARGEARPAFRRALKAQRGLGAAARRAVSWAPRLVSSRPEADLRERPLEGSLRPQLQFNIHWTPNRSVTLP